MNVFDEMGIYWAEIADKNQTGQQVQFLKNQLKPSEVILDLACGSGRHSIALTKAGFDIVGLDVSTRLLRTAKQQCHQIQLIRADMRLLPLKTAAFTAVVSMDTSFGYLPSETDDLVSLAEIRRVLQRDGVLIIDVFNRKHFKTKYQGITETSKQREYPSFFLLQQRTLSENGDYLCDSWTVQDKAGGQMRVFQHTVRLYDSNALKALLDKAGFAVSGEFGGYSGESYSADSSRLILVANAK
jgi:ubiquinone/menaquinone biosynthesis C-methylase UbiE